MSKPNRAINRWGLAGLAIAAAGLLFLAVSYGPLSALDAGSFSGDRAFALLKRQCDFGPRPVGTVAHEKLRASLLDSMKAVTDKAALQDFDWTRRGKKYRLSNIIGVLNPTATPKLMISAHWDTRPTSDQDKDPANRSKPILGANDGASGVAVVLELARVLKAKRPAIGVIFMLFDGEDVGPDVGNMFLGAKYFAKNMGDYRPERMILVDMIGDSDLQIYKELNSLSSDRDTVTKVWDAAGQLGYRAQFPNSSKWNIEDDHIPLQEAGVPSIDLIDFDYPYWHTQADTVDKCNAASLQTVGRTLEAVIRNWKPG